MTLSATISLDDGFPRAHTRIHALCNAMCRSRHIYSYQVIHTHIHGRTERERHARLYGHSRAHSHAALSLMHRQNKFAYACDRVQTELRDGKWVDSSLMEPAGQEREWNTSALPLESNVAGG